MNTINNIGVFATAVTGVAFATITGINNVADSHLALNKNPRHPSVHISHGFTSNTFSRPIHFVGAEAIVSETEILQAFSTLYRSLAANQTGLGDDFEKLTTEELWAHFA